MVSVELLLGCHALISDEEKSTKIGTILSEDEEKFVDSCISHVKLVYKGRRKFSCMVVTENLPFFNRALVLCPM